MSALISVSLGIAAGFSALYLSRFDEGGAGDGVDGGESDSTDIQGAITGLVMGRENSLKTSASGVDLIKRFEGFRLTAYDANPPHGDLTIGYGHKLLPTEHYGKVTEEFATRLLVSDIEMAEKRVNDWISFQLSQNQFDALVSLAYNLTYSSWKKAASRLNGGQSPETVFPLYVNAGGVRLSGLANRRAAELKFYKGVNA